MENTLWTLILKLQKSGTGRFLVSLAYNCGLIYIWNFFSYRKDKAHPTDEMLQSRKFFEHNKERIKRNLELLCDSESKNTYIRCIRYRCTHDDRDRPKYNRKNQYFPENIINIQGGGYKLY